MQFEVLPLLEIMLDFYQKPRNRGRFEDYLRLLYNKDKNQLLLPLPLFNPMAKDHVIDKLGALKQLDLENLMGQAVQEVNTELKRLKLPPQSIRFAFSLADDLRGGWTNRYSTDYGNTFQAKGLLNRKFWTCIFWTSEHYDQQLLQHRIRQNLWRCVYQIQHHFPNTLFEHLAQEAFVQSKIPGAVWEGDSARYALVLDFIKTHRENTDLPKLITFFYGDVAAESLGYAPLGIPKNTGFQLAERLWKAAR